VALERQRHRQEELERTTAFEQRLMGIVGHDIRTPLASILLSARQQLESGKLADDSARAFGRISRGAERILSIAELLMDFTRSCMGQGIPVRRERVDLRELARTLVDEVRHANPGRTVTLSEPAQPLSGCWDPGRMGQVLANLMDNAVKYGALGTPIHLTLQSLADREVRLTVHNHGAPIPPAHQPGVFEPFQRGPDATHGEHSMGLGLYISREIVQAHGGTIEVRSEEGAGTTFEVVLPVVDLPCDEPDRASAR
jgi:signal transduction histidine kinase